MNNQFNDDNEDQELISANKDFSLLLKAKAINAGLMERLEQRIIQSKIDLEKYTEELNNPVSLSIDSNFLALLDRYKESELSEKKDIEVFERALKNILELKELAISHLCKTSIQSIYNKINLTLLSFKKLHNS